MAAASLWRSRLRHSQWARSLGVTVEDRILELCTRKEEIATEILSVDADDRGVKKSVDMQEIGRLIH